MCDQSSLCIDAQSLPELNAPINCSFSSLTSHGSKAVSKVLREASDWIGRTLAAMLAIAVPGLVGHWLDDYFETRFLTPCGIIGGMVLSTTALVMLLQAKNPPRKLHEQRKPQDEPSGSITASSQEKPVDGEF